jgi:hypothetical protein
VSANHGATTRKEEIVMTTTHVVDPVLVARPTQRRTLRSIGAVVGGLVSTFIATTAIDVVLHALGIYPPVGVRMADSLFLVAIVYRIVLNIGGSYVAARLAPSRPLRHALALGVIGTVIATAGAVAMWAAGPAWYSLANIALALPCAWAGGKLFNR